MTIKGKIALVTGSSSGIGKAIAKLFLEEGATVWLNGRNSEKLLAVAKELAHQTGNPRVYYYAADCTDETHLRAFYEVVKEQSGHLDILVSNVGDGRSNSDPISSSEHWTNVWDTNFQSALFSARAFTPLLKGAGANILFVSSIVALEAFGAPVDYSTAKAAVNAFAKNLARKLAPKIRVNVIAPGNVFFKGGSWEEKIIKDPGKVQIMLETSVPLKRFGTPEEIAEAACFLCSDKASFITGSTLVVDGGQTVGVV